MEVREEEEEEEEEKNAYRLLLEKAEGKRPLGKPRRRWVDNIQMDLKVIRLDLSGSEYGPVESSCEHGNEPLDSIK
jgi:hypothetical protein